MRYKNSYLISGVFICFLLVTGFSYTQSSLTQKLKLTVSSSKNKYKLGEIVDLSFNLRNEGNETISFSDVFGTGTGFLHLKISQDGINFRDFSHPRWGKVDVGGAKTLLRSEESAKASTTLLWEWAKQDVPSFTFFNPGIYYVKANYRLSIDNAEESVLLESQPLEITIEEPTGEDLQIWNIIKGDGEFAYFIQENDFRIPKYKTEERAKFQNKVEQIIRQYPNSFYTHSLQQCLDKFKANEAKRKAYLQKV